MRKVNGYMRIHKNSAKKLGHGNRSIPYQLPREWVSLSDEEINDITICQWGAQAVLAAHRAYARAIDAMLKEKNDQGN